MPGRWETCQVGPNTSKEGKSPWENHCGTPRGEPCARQLLLGPSSVFPSCWRLSFFSHRLGINMVVAGSDPTRPHPPSSRTYLEIPYECARSRPPPARPLPRERIRCERVRHALTPVSAPAPSPATPSPGWIFKILARAWSSGLCEHRSTVKSVLFLGR